jgi:hypothetical protein
MFKLDVLGGCSPPRGGQARQPRTAVASLARVGVADNWLDGEGWWNRPPPPLPGDYLTSIQPYIFAKAKWGRKLQMIRYFPGSVNVCEYVGSLGGPKGFA